MFRAVYLSTNVMLSAISATLFAILPAMIAYADCEPCVGLSPATEAALVFAGVALGWTGLVAPLTADLGAGFLTGARGAVGFLGVAPLIVDGRCTCVAIVAVLLLLPRRFRPRAARRTRFEACTQDGEGVGGCHNAVRFRWKSRVLVRF